MAISAMALEPWIWYGVCMSVIGARLASRRLSLGSWRRLQMDDYLMVFVALPFSTMIVTASIVDRFGTNIIPPGEPIDVTPKEAKDRVYGSKMAVIEEESTIFTVWACKGCMLIIYSRLTRKLAQNIAVKLVAAYTIIGFTVLQILFFTAWCHPWSDLWSFPPTTEQCGAMTHHVIVSTVLNLSSDLMILGIMMPIFIKIQLPWKRKLIVVGLFGLGIFTILAIVLNRIYLFTEPYGTAWPLWNIREAATATLTANIPLLWPLLQYIFKLHSFAEPTDGRSYPLTKSSGRSRLGLRSQLSATEHEAGTSSEHINKTEASTGIWRHVQVTVQEDAAKGTDNFNLR